MHRLIITIDVDWACEPATEELLEFLEGRGVVPTLFTTHDSPAVASRLDQMEVGLHPFFDPGSSHGSTVADVVAHVLDLPHNLPAYRCHRYACCNTSRGAMAEAGMRLCSNVCTDLEVVTPFVDRFGLLEVPIYLEDGGYLWRNHPLDQLPDGAGVITIHPMHFAINTPHFDYMVDIKRSLSRDGWRGMTKQEVDRLRWKGRGIRDFLIDLIDSAPETETLGQVLAAHAPAALQPV